MNVTTTSFCRLFHNLKKTDSCLSQDCGSSYCNTPHPIEFVNQFLISMFKQLCIKYVLFVLKNFGLQSLKTFGLLDPIHCHQLNKKASSGKIKSSSVAYGPSIMSGKSYLTNSIQSGVLPQDCLCSFLPHFSSDDQQNYNLTKS